MNRVLMLFVAITALSCHAQNVEQLLSNAKAEYAPDSRCAVWEVNCCADGDGKYVLKGVMDNIDNKRALFAMMDSCAIDYVDSIQVLDAGWAIVDVSVASMRTQGRHSSEMATQAVMGTPVRVLETGDEWYRVQTPDNYIAYIPTSLIVPKSLEQMAAWRRSQRVIVTVNQAELVSLDGNDRVCDLVLGNILEYKGEEDGMTVAVTPDGRIGRVQSGAVADFDKWAQQDFDADVVINTAKQMMGVPYLWGGTSTKLADCSGFTKVCYFANAIILQRDASQQALSGQRISAQEWRNAKKGDLLFWGNEQGRVTHVGLYVADGMLIHCSGMVKWNSLDPEDERFINRTLLSISRVDKSVGDSGITAVKSHPWYFEQE